MRTKPKDPFASRAKVSDNEKRLDILVGGVLQQWLRWLVVKYTNTNTQIHKYTNTQIQIHKYTNTKNTNIHTNIKYQSKLSIDGVSLNFLVPSYIPG